MQKGGFARFSITGGFAVAMLAVGAGNAAADEGTFAGLRVAPQTKQALLGPEAQGFRLSLGSVSAAPLAAAGWNPLREGRDEGDRDLAPPGLPSASLGLTPRTPFADLPETRALLDYKVSNWTMSSSVRQGLGARGTTVDVGASYGFSLAPRHSLALLGSLGAGSHDVARTYLNESELLIPRAPGLGFRDVGARLSLLYSFDQRWYVNTSLGYSRLLLDPQDVGSGDRNVTSFGASFGFRF